jgi:hypothetical protein
MMDTISYHQYIHSCNVKVSEFGIHLTLTPCIERTNHTKLLTASRRNDLSIGKTSASHRTAGENADRADHAVR